MAHFVHRNRGTCSIAVEFELEDGLVIRGSSKNKPLSGGSVSAFGDHRIAMAAAVASFICSGAVEISGAEAVQKSYPDFWQDLEMLTN